MRRFLLLPLLLFIPMPAFAQPPWVAVTRVINAKSCVLASGDTVRLASIEAPNVEEKADGSHGARPGEPLGEEARLALEKLIGSRSVRIDYNPARRDRHNRLLGQLTRDDGLWVQGELLKEGWAMVYSFSDDRQDVIEKMLAAEREARAAKRGIWSDGYYRVIAPSEAGEFINRFKLVEGKVISVNDYHGHTFINFSEHWKGSFAVFVSRKYAEAFAALPLHSLVGKTIRVRGWIDYHNAPEINLTHPQQIEVE